MKKQAGSTRLVFIDVSCDVILYQTNLSKTSITAF